MPYFRALVSQHIAHPLVLPGRSFSRITPFATFLNPHLYKMVRLATSLLAVSFVVLPALAAPTEQYERSVAESDLYGRDPANLEDIIVTREDLEEIFGREFVNDIDERGFGGAFRFAKGLAGKFGHHHSHSLPSMGSNDNSNGNNNNYGRELVNDIDERGFGGAFRFAKGLAGKFGHHHSHSLPSMGSNDNSNSNNNYGRDLVNDIDERGFGGAFRLAKGLAGKFGHHHSHSLPSMGSNDNSNSNNNYGRELVNDIDERGFGGAFRLAKGLAGKFGHHHSHNLPSMGSNDNSNSNNNNYGREFDEEEFDLREFDDDEFLAREYYDDLD